jgi:eukaryotic-like serine/threonine-protein kinase
MKRRAPPGNGDDSSARDSCSGRVFAKRWTITKTLGVGGTSTVYEAVHRNGRRVAVKVLHSELASHPTIRKRFSSEGYAANRVQHPNAVAVLDDGEEPDGTAFLVMELLEGQSLARALSERGALSVGEVVAAALSTLEVLAAAHDNGVVHRDVKPGNIFATADGRFKLLDFGVAQVADLASSVVTQTGGTVGTPAFMAPEQAAGRVSEVDALTDIWAMGATMFQLLTNRLVHQAASHNGMIVAAATIPAPPIRSLAPSVPAEIAQVIDRALAFERCERWPNARAMHLALRSACPEFSQVAFVEPLDPETLPEQRATPTDHEIPLNQSRFKPWHPLLILVPLLLAVLALFNPQKPASVAQHATQPLVKVSAAGPPAWSTKELVAPPTATASGANSPLNASMSVPRQVTPDASSVPQKTSRRAEQSRFSVAPRTDDELLDRRK